MIFQAKYEFTKELTNIVIDLNCLKALEKILLDNSMQYQICVEYKNGDTLYDLAIHDIEEDLSKDKRQIDSLNVNANNDDIGFELILALSAIFLKKVEIDVGINHTKTRRNFGYFILTVVLIPVILTWIFSFV